MRNKNEYYLNEFETAVRLTRDWCAPTLPNIVVPRGERLFDGRLDWFSLLERALASDLVQNFRPIIERNDWFRTPGSRVGQCCAVHALAQNGLEMALGGKAAFTIGYVSTSDGATFFQTDFAELRSFATQVASRGGVATGLKLHAWLTFASAEILDLTICPTLRARGRLEFSETDVVSDYPWISDRLTYHPVAVGRNVLVELRALS